MPAKDSWELACLLAVMLLFAGLVVHMPGGPW